MMANIKDFYVGISEISAFLRLSYRTCARYLREGKVTGAKKDCLGRWVLAAVDYYASLQDPDSPEAKPE
jgi:hypothetical protein